MDVNRLKSFLTSESGVLLIIIVSFTVVSWLVPVDYNFKFAFFLLGCGIFFDVISFIIHVGVIITKKFSSGFLGIGLVFYGWFIIVSRFSIIGSGQTTVSGILLYKIADILLLLGFSLFCHLPLKFQQPRENYE